MIRLHDVATVKKLYPNWGPSDNLSSYFRSGDPPQITYNFTSRFQLSEEEVQRLTQRYWEQEMTFNIPAINLRVGSINDV